MHGRGEGMCGREGGSRMQGTWVMGEGTCLVCHASGREGTCMHARTWGEKQRAAVGPHMDASLHWACVGGLNMGWIWA